MVFIKVGLNYIDTKEPQRCLVYKSIVEDPENGVAIISKIAKNYNITRQTNSL